jgi:hypothetical protein
MSKKIKITAGQIEMTAKLNDTKVAKQLWDILPINAIGNRWGDEIYFSIPVRTEGENLQGVVEIGDIAYWPEGPAFCIFFGPTPVSSENEIRPASPVQVLGKLLGNPEDFKEVKSGTKIILEKI